MKKMSHDVKGKEKMIIRKMEERLNSGIWSELIIEIVH